MKYYCGIDLGNKSSLLCVISEKRKVVWEGKVATEEGEFEKVLKKFKSLECLVEASPLAEWLCDVVERRGHAVRIVCARKAQAMMSAMTKKKTDRKDAQSLAELCRSGWYASVHRKSREGRELRSYLTARKQLVEASIALSSSIRGILRSHGIRLNVRNSVLESPIAVKKAIKPLPELARDGVKAILEAYMQLHTQEKNMYRDLKKFTKQNEITALLMTIPAVGPATAAAFVATIDDPHRFSNAEQVASYVGIVPSIYQSGETEYRGRITKAGNKLLRWLLVEAAHILLTRHGKDCALKSWGLRLAEKKGPGKARVAVARKLCALMWQLWIKHEPFILSKALVAA